LPAARLHHLICALTWPNSGHSARACLHQLVGLAGLRRIVAERMRTKPRFIRRLIAERRIEYVKVGRHVRISEPALAAFIAAGRVQPMTSADVWPQMRPVA